MLCSNISTAGYLCQQHICICSKISLSSLDTTSDLKKSGNCIMTCTHSITKRQTKVYLPSGASVHMVGVGITAQLPIFFFDNLGSSNIPSRFL
jgi:hypothetical protein